VAPSAGARHLFHSVLLYQHDLKHSLVIRNGLVRRHRASFLSTLHPRHGSFTFQPGRFGQLGHDPSRYVGRPTDSAILCIRRLLVPPTRHSRASRLVLLFMSMASDACKTIRAADLSPYCRASDLAHDTSCHSLPCVVNAIACTRHRSRALPPASFFGRLSPSSHDQIP